MIFITCHRSNDWIFLILCRHGHQTKDGWFRVVIANWVRSHGSCDGLLWLVINPWLGGSLLPCLWHIQCVFRILSSSYTSICIPGKSFLQRLDACISDRWVCVCVASDTLLSGYLSITMGGSGFELSGFSSLAILPTFVPREVGAPPPARPCSRCIMIYILSVQVDILLDLQLDRAVSRYRAPKSAPFWLLPTFVPREVGAPLPVGPCSRCIMMYILSVQVDILLDCHCSTQGCLWGGSKVGQFSPDHRSPKKSIRRGAPHGSLCRPLSPAKSVLRHLWDPVRAALGCICY